MRETRPSGSEGGGAELIGPPYPYRLREQAGSISTRYHISLRIPALQA